MKIFQLSILALLILIFISCKKDDGNISPLEGSWELKSSTDGMTGSVTEYPANNGNSMVFTGLNYQIFSNHQLVKSGTFKVVEETSIISNSKGKRIIYDNELDRVRSFFNIRKANLDIYVDAFDGPSASYTKKQ